MPDHPQAFLSGVLYDPETKQADQMVVLVEYGPGKARLQIDVPPTPINDLSTPDQLAPLLRELGEALRRIADEPQTIHTHRRES